LRTFRFLDVSPRTVIGAVMGGVWCGGLGAKTGERGSACREAGAAIMGGRGGHVPPNILVGGRKGKCPPLIAHMKTLWNIDARK